MYPFQIEKFKKNKRTKVYFWLAYGGICRFNLNMPLFDYYAIIQSLRVPFLNPTVYRFSFTLVDNHLGI